MPPLKPMITGRFNFLTVRENTCHVIFTPFDENVTILVARNLPYSEATDLYKALNEELDHTRDNLQGISGDNIRIGDDDGLI